MAWIQNDDPCPRCEGVCENEVETREDGHEYNLAERCPKCRWIVRFDNEDEEIKAVRY